MLLIHVQLVGGGAQNSLKVSLPMGMDQHMSLSHVCVRYFLPSQIASKRERELVNVMTIVNGKF
jgi:hypothetical protein